MKTLPFPEPVLFLEFFVRKSAISALTNRQNFRLARYFTLEKAKPYRAMYQVWGNQVLDYLPN
jgi:hypothetical protein